MKKYLIAAIAAGVVLCIIAAGAFMLLCKGND